MKLEDLKRPMPFKWRVQSANQYGAKCVAYIDARDVQDRLDEVCGINGWQVKYNEHKGNLFATIGIYDGQTNEWIWKEDCGVESNVEKQKGEASDAFKRAAVMWGCGRFLYSMPIISLPVKQDGVDRQNKPKYSPYSEKKGKFIKSANDITDWCNSMLGNYNMSQEITELIKQGRNGSK